MNWKPSVTLAKSYIVHNNEWFFVSTIDRDSSSPYGSRYAETMVWNLEGDIGSSRGDLLWQGEASQGSISEHQRIVEAIYTKGREAFNDEEK